jgi:L-iditol 2-dehydrogenase
MKALRFNAQDTPAIEELPIPEIKDDEVLVAARSVGVCHSDIDLLGGRYIIPFSYPIIPGHEWSGEVVKVGAKVADFAPGDPVVGECVIGDDHFGFSISGAAAEFFVARPEWLHKLPEGVDYKNGALVEPFSVAYYALMKTGNVNASDVLVVLGAGPVGLAVVAGAVNLGATVVVSEPAEYRREAALSLGAARAVAPEDLDAVLDELTGGRGADAVLEVTGNPIAMARALEIAAFQGRVTYVGIDVGREAPARLGLIQSKELKISGAIGSPGVWPETLRFMAKRGIDLAPLVTSTYTVDEALDAIEAAHVPGGSTIKAHITFTGTLS